MDIGVYLKSLSERNIEAIATTGLNFVVLDMEHTPLGLERLYALNLACEASGLSAVVRLPSKAEEYFKWVLDLGIPLVQIPHVSSCQDLHAIRERALYQPVGNRGLCKFVRAAQYSNLSVSHYLKGQNQSTKLIYQIEGRDAVNAIDDILTEISQRPDINEAIFIGPYDLSQALGLPGEVWSEVVVKKMTEIIHKCLALGIEVGTFTDTKSGIRFWREQGVNFLQYASDLALLMTSCRSVFDAAQDTKR